MPTTTAKAGLTVPVLGDASPAHVTAVAGSLALLDVHNHAEGHGSQVPSAGINVNAALPCGGFSAQQVRSLRLQNLGAPLGAGADNGSLFVSGGELYFLDGAGRTAKFTAAGVINSGGPFKGDYVAYGARVSYSHATRQYTFVDESNALAAIKGVPRCAGAAGFGNSAPAIGAAGVSFLPANTAANSTMVDCTGDLVAQGGFAHTAFAATLQLSQSLSGTWMVGVASSYATSSWVAPRSGSVIGISYYYAANQTAGVLSFTVVKNSSTFLCSSANFTAGQAGSTTFAKDTKAFAAGDRLQLTVNTDGNFFYPFAHVVAYVHVEY